MSIFNKRLKELMKENGFSQAELGRITSIPRTTIADYVNEKSSPKHDNLIKLATALDVDFEYLTGVSDVKSKHEENIIEHMIGEFQYLNDLIADLPGEDVLLINSVIEKNNEYKGYYDNPFKDLLEILSQMNDLDLKDLRAYAKYRLDNPR